jgi:ectoine hydroxylase-related dioxygenase (phytanoyl-CoA dioxygenase family)
MGEKKLHTSAFVPGGKIDESNRQHYRENGFLIAENLFTPNDIEKIKQEAISIFKGERGEMEGLVEIKEDAAHQEVLKNYNAIHFPHKISDQILSYLKDERVARVLQGIVSENVKGVQSMLFVKAPGKPGQSWHQDEYFIPSRDRSLTGVWIAIDDAKIDNGCLWVIPGSHKAGSIRRRVKYEGNEYADLETCELQPYTKQDEVPVEIKAGSVLFFNGYLLHSSLRNKTKENYRMALVNHYISAESYLPWDPNGDFDKFVMDCRDIVMVAGKDPYAYKGTEDIARVFIRPDVLKPVEKKLHEREE